LNPKLNFGLWNRFEGGVGFEAALTEGKEIEFLPDGTVEQSPRTEFEASAVGLGIKWGFVRRAPLRLALAFDSRIAINRGRFGTLPSTIYNLELDGDYEFTTRFSLGSNLQFLTSDQPGTRDQVVFDLAGIYSFSDRFRGMLFGSAIQDDEADDVLLFTGFAGQYVFEQHSFTVALDIQLNEARREVRTQRQLDVEFSYTFTF
jgi:hypothetical protein